MSLIVFVLDFFVYYFMFVKLGIGSVWWVDDEGEISVDDFDVLFGFDGLNGVVIVIFWVGVEGINLGFY